MTCYHLSQPTVLIANAKRNDLRAENINKKSIRVVAQSTTRPMAIKEMLPEKFEKFNFNLSEWQKHYKNLVKSWLKMIKGCHWLTMFHLKNDVLYLPLLKSSASSVAGRFELPTDGRMLHTCGSLPNNTFYL